MQILFVAMLLLPCALADICCPPSRSYEGDVHSILLRTTLKYAIDLDEQKMVMYSAVPTFDYFDYVDLKANIAYEHFDGTTCYAVHPYPFGCIPTGAVEQNTTIEDSGRELRLFKYESPFDSGYRNFTTEWMVDENCITVKQSLTFPFRDTFEYYYSNFVSNVTDPMVFERDLSRCRPLGTPLKAV